MICPRCGSTRVSCQVVSETNLKTKHHSVLWWAFVGWWWMIIKWFCFTLPALVVKLFRPKRYVTTTTHKSTAVCQDCGHAWMTGTEIR